MARLFLVRHGETSRQSSKRFWGRTDVTLGAVGRRQAEQIRDRLAAEKLDIVYSSPLQRAFYTAGVIASKHGVEVVTCPELREIDFGEIEGLDFSEIHRRFPAVERSWADRSPTLSFPGGESLMEMEERVAGFPKRLTGINSNGAAVVVSHYGVLRTMICQMLELDIKNRWNIKIDLASVSTIETFPGINILSLLNDLSHLKEGKNGV